MRAKFGVLTWPADMRLRNVMKLKAAKIWMLVLLGSSIIWGSSERPSPISDQVVQGYMTLMKAQDAKTIYSLVEKQTKKTFTVDALSSLLRLQKRLYGNMQSYTYKGETITGSKITTISAEVKDCFKKSNGLYKLKFVRGKRDKDFYLTKFYFTPVDTQRFELVDSIVAPFLTDIGNEDLAGAYRKTSGTLKKTLSKDQLGSLTETIRKKGIGSNTQYKTHIFSALGETLVSEVQYLVKSTKGKPILLKLTFIQEDTDWLFSGLTYDMQW